METVVEGKLTLSDQFKSALSLVARVLALKVIKTKDDFEAANSDYKAIIAAEKELDRQYSELPCVVMAKEAQAQKKLLAERFDTAKKTLKNGPMLAYENEQKRIAQKKADEEAAKLKAKADAEAKEAARLREIEAKKAEAEAARIAEEARKKAEVAAKIEAERKKKAAAELARLKIEGDKKALAEAKAREVIEKENARLAAIEAEKQAKAEAEAAKARAEAERAEAERIKTEAANRPIPVVLAKKTTPSVSRRTVTKWRLTTKDGRKLTHEDFKKVQHIRPADLNGLPAHFFEVDPTMIQSQCESLGKAAEIPGCLETWTENC